MPNHQASLVELEKINQCILLAYSPVDMKWLQMEVSTVKGIKFRVKKKDVPSKIFMDLASAVKRYNE